jgi:DnaJ-domain-containing protein 1
MTDAFEVLGLPVAFVTLPAQIQRAYMARAAAVHPDAAGQAGGDLDVDADTASARLNRAKDTLLDDEQRAAVVLARLGGPAANQDRSLPPDLLAEMMDKRSEFETARNSGSTHAMDVLRDWAECQRLVRLQTVTELFASATALPAGAERQGVLKSIRMELNAWRYIHRMIEQVSE